MVYTKKKYLKELRTNPYWEVEPHFWYWAMIKTVSKYFETALKNKMSPNELNSALYGEFIIKGKPMLEGFIHNFNLTLKVVEKILQEARHSHS